MRIKSNPQVNTPKAIQSLGDARIAEADSLFSTGHYDLAFYVAGYAVELYLKARISLHLNIPDFFDFENRRKFGNEDSITKPYKVHNFEQLLILSGLFAEHHRRLLEPGFSKDWEILDKWKESQRYNYGKTSKQARDLIDSVKNYTIWIGQFL